MWIKIVEIKNNNDFQPIYRTSENPNNSTTQ